jgi:hypothetical protein
MATPKWEPGKLYAPGALVVPRTALPNVPVSLQNPGFETGDATGWDFDIDNPGETSPNVTNYGPYNGVYNVMFDCDGGTPRTTIIGLNQEQPTCQPNTLISGSIWLKFSKAGASGGQAIIAFYDNTNTLIGTYTLGTLYQKPGNTSERWYQSTVSAVAPALTASVRIGFKAFIENDADIRFDLLQWNYNSAAPLAGLQYKAVQAEIGTSADTEPTWPPTLGTTVVDNEVTWEAVLMSRVVWEARPILRSGATEPTWPTTIGDAVADNTISWITATRQVEEAPNSKVVAITASKVFAADKDIIRYSATVNPLDWTSTDNAGYLPSGLNQNGSNDTAVLNIYRSSLVGFSSSTFQNWQVDEDPANMELLDVMEGIGSTWQHAAQPVAKDLFYLAALGVRTVGISGGSVNLVNGDAGMPIDPLVREQIKLAQQNETEPRGMYYPSLGQYMLAFPSPQAVACSIPETYVGDIAFPSTRAIYLGPGTGTVTLEFITGPIPDKFEVFIGGEKVLDTGYRGAVSRQAQLDAALEARGLPPETIVEYAGDGVPMYGTFNKTTTDLYATVKVWAPLPGTGWNFSLSCPDGETPVFPDPTTETFVYSMSSLGEVGAWSVYNYPWPIEAHAMLGNDLYVRSGDAVFRIDPSRLHDQDVNGDDVEVIGEIQSHYLDMGSPAVTKMMIGVDLVGNGQARIAIGFNQNLPTAFTSDAAVPADTVPGSIIPIPLAAPSFAMRIRYSSLDNPDGWEWLASSFYINDFRPAV